jgi:nitroreductase
MNTRLLRRDFFKKSLVLGTGAFLPWLGTRNLKAKEKQQADQEFSNETINTIKALRTIHGNFAKKEIPEAKIQLILKSCMRAANASNMQTYSIIVVRDADQMKQLCGYQASLMLLFCVDYNRLKASAEYLGHSYHPDDISNFVTGSMNTVLAAQTAVIAAKSLGIDSLLTNGIHRGDMERVWNTLDLPKTHCFPLIALLLGYPAEEPDHLKGRLDDLGIVHQEKYHPLTADDLKEIVQEYDDKEKHIALNENWDQEGHKHYLDWLFKAWLGRSAKPAEAETQMFKLLKRSGFVDLQKS